MFDSLSDRLGGVFDKLRGRGALTEDDVRAAMREVRIALLEADVALPVVRQFVDQATERAVGSDVLRSVTPGQMVVKIVSDTLTETLGSDTSDLMIDVTPPAVIMMVGLQGSGKTTSTAKIAKRLREKERKPSPCSETMASSSCSQKTDHQVKHYYAAQMITIIL